MEIVLQDGDGRVLMRCSLASFVAAACSALAYSAYTQTPVQIIEQLSLEKVTLTPPEVFQIQAWDVNLSERFTFDYLWEFPVEQTWTSPQMDERTPGRPRRMSDDDDALPRAPSTDRGLGAPLPNHTLVGWAADEGEIFI